MIGTKTFDALELRKNRIGWNAFKRWYAPEVGRWISEDPIGFEAGDANLYRYVGNEVTGATDPSGLRRDKDLTKHVQSDWAGRTILRWWLTGRGKTRWIVDDQRWTEYMKADKSLRAEVRNQILHEAARLAELHVNGNTSTLLAFPAELANGEGIIGYEYLHGTNPDFKIITDAQIRHSNGRKGRPCATVTFDARFWWHDRIDPNPKYGTDTIKSLFGETITMGNAEDYDIHISWKNRIAVKFDDHGNIVEVKGWPYLYGPPQD